MINSNLYPQYRIDINLALRHSHNNQNNYHLPIVEPKKLTFIKRLSALKLLKKENILLFSLTKPRKNLKKSHLPCLVQTSETFLCISITNPEKIRLEGSEKTKYRFSDFPTLVSWEN